MTFDEKIRAAAAAALGFTLSTFISYALIAGAFWVTLYVIFRKPLRRKIVPRFPSSQQQMREVYHSIISLAVFGVVFTMIVLAELSGYRTKVYVKIDMYGWIWYIATLIIAVHVHDAYFYWTHRLLHVRGIFRRMHRVHHLSTNPTPWAAYSFNVGEAFVQAGIAPLLLYTMPMHYSAFLLFMTWQITFNVLGHCGYECFPRWFLNTWMGKFMNTVTHHGMHHEKINGNFGLYFNYWDRLMGTNHADYEERFEAVTAASRPGRNPVRMLARRVVEVFAKVRLRSGLTKA